MTLRESVEAVLSAARLRRLREDEVLLSQWASYIYPLYARRLPNTPLVPESYVEESYRER